MIPSRVIWDHSAPMDAANFLSLSCGKGTGSSRPRDVFFLKCGATHYQRDCNARKSTGKQLSGKRKQSKSWFKSEGKGKSQESKGKAKETSKGTKCAKGLNKGKTSKVDYQVLKTGKQGQVRKLRNLHRRVPLTIIGFMMSGVMTNGVIMNGMMIGVLLDGTKVVNKRVTIAQAHFHVEVLISVS